MPRGAMALVRTAGFFFLATFLAATLCFTGAFFLALAIWAVFLTVVLWCTAGLVEVWASARGAKASIATAAAEARTRIRRMIVLSSMMSSWDERACLPAQYFTRGPWVGG